MEQAFLACLLKHTGLWRTCRECCPKIDLEDEEVRAALLLPSLESARAEAKAMAQREATAARILREKGKQGGNDAKQQKEKKRNLGATKEISANKRPPVLGTRELTEREEELLTIVGMKVRKLRTKMKMERQTEWGKVGLLSSC